MKKLTALILVCLLFVATAYAGEWPEGLSPAQPMPGVPEVDLNETMGYRFLTPCPGGLEAHVFCDVLEIWMPREDVVLGTGHAHLYEDEVEIADLDFANPDQVELRSLEQQELEYYFRAHPWGGGVCIEMHLPISLKIGATYYVTMDENCFSAADGKVTNPKFTEKDQWNPVMIGDFGVESLYYQAAPEPEPTHELTEEELKALEEEEGDIEEEPTPAPTEEPDEGPVAPKDVPEVGDIIHFNLTLGGDAVTAVVFSENDSASFDELEYHESCVVKGTVTKEDLDWGVVFLDANNEQVDYISHLG